MTEKKGILFLCTGNACRSQMAEGILRHLALDRFEVFSAGTHPTRVHPMSVKVMEEWGIDISHHTSDHVNDYLNQRLDTVITLCDSANERCPVFPDKVERIHWSIPDPFRGWGENERFLAFYREARDLIRNQIDSFLNSR
ncbi:MAG: arsenate reductase ArsC [Candidatus Neomarinimicrobiota bacterium]